MLLLPSLLFAGAGFVLLVRGWRPARRGDTAHCRTCDYILIDAEVGRCPECGTRTHPGGVVRGERHRRGGLALAGLFLALIGTGGVGVVVAGWEGAIDWAHYKPLSWLLKDMDSPVAADARAAASEVARRILVGSLSGREQKVLVEKALQAQVAASSHPYDEDLFGVLTTQFQKHQLSAEQEERFFAGALKVELLVRPVIGSEDPVPYWTFTRGRGPSGWWTCNRLVEWQMDDGPIDRHNDGWGGSSSFGGSGSGKSLPPQTVGKHRLRVRVALSTRVGAASQNSDQGPFDKVVTREVTATFECVKGHVAIATTAAPAAAVLAPMLSAKVSVYGTGSAANLNLNVDARPLPVDVAFDCAVVVEGREYPCGSVNFHAGRGGSYGTGGNRLPPTWPATVDVILRSSERVARGTLDMATMWKGEVVLKGVPVRLPAGAKGAATKGS